MYRGLIEEYRPYLPIAPEVKPVTLLEGRTPLLPVPRLAASTGCDFELYVKVEGANPTGSFKDRGMTMAVTHAVSQGARAVICASTGNTSASAAAYATRAGIDCVVLIPEGKIALGKLAQALIQGAKVIQVQGNFDVCLNLVRELTQKHPIALVNSVNPYRIEGQKTAAFEIVDVLGNAPDLLAIPVGNAGNITAYWKGFTEYHSKGKAKNLPTLWGFQAAGSAPLVDGHPVENPETIATAIRIGNPASWEGAIAAKTESGGRIEKVTDEEILEAYSLLARLEGVFCEPASAASLAGVLRSARRGELAGKRVVAVLTGNGLKDPDTAIGQSPRPQVVSAEYARVEEVVLG